jgi:C1A family cysteine protease
MNDINKISNIETNIDTRNMKSVLETRRPININVIKDKNIVNTINNISNSESPKYIPKYGWVPDIPDHRDYQYSDLRKKMEEIAEKEKETASPIRKRTITTVDNIQIPTPPLPFVDLRSTDSPIFDQGNLGSCTGNALAGALQFFEKKDKVPYIELSRLFVYYDERVAENTINIDSGAQLRDGIKTLAKLGVCSETCWPYNIQNFAIQPDHRCYREAANHRILIYYRINTLDDMKHCLNNGYPFVFGFSCYQSMETENVVKTGIIPMPTGKERLLGGHAVMAIGYNDNTKKFIIRNSWGVGWGDKGYGYIDYEYLTNRNLSDDFWTIRK